MKRIARILCLGLSVLLVVQPICFALPTEDRDVARKQPGIPMVAKSPARKSRAQDAPQLPGQTITILPGGRLLVVGGEGPTGSEKSVAVRDSQTGQDRSMGAGLRHARAWHTATMLPDGRVLILGGVGANGRIVNSAEIVDPDTEGSKPVATPQEAARAYHTATLLTDGRVLIAGGQSENGEIVDTAVFWDFRSENFDVVPVRLSNPRRKHKATLLNDGNILFERGDDSGNNPISTAELFDVGLRRFAPSNMSTELPDQSSPYLTGSLPNTGQTEVPVNTLVSLRFSKQIRAESLNSATLILNGPEGQVPAKVVPAERGRLAFLTPKQNLLSGSTYTVSVAGVVDDEGHTVSTTSIIFTTKSSQPINDAAPTDEDWTPNEDNLYGNWKSKVKDSPWRSLPLLNAADGVTALAGQVLLLNGRPLDKVTIQIGGRAVTTDATGRFLLTEIPEGHQVMLIDGRTASRNKQVYGTFKVGVKIVAGKTNPLGYTIWMPKLDVTNAVTISAPTRGPLTLTNPKIPGLELRLPAGTLIRDIDGQAVTQLTMTPIPTNQPPFPLPPGVDVPVYFTIQPGGSQIIPPRAQLIYPNFTRSAPGTRIDFWNYEPSEKGWYIYGRGTVTPDGKQVVPDAGVTLYEFSGAMIGLPSLAPLFGPIAGLFDGDPVNLDTGLFVLEKRDLFVSDTVPINLTRTYRPNDTVSKAFGIGSTHPYDMFLVGDRFPYTYVDLILPDGGRVHYDRISPGTGWGDAVYETTTRPGAFYKSRVNWNGGGWDLKLKDGTVFAFPDGFTANRPMQAGVLRIQDRFGNALTMTRDSNGNLTKINSPNNRWIEFTYDSSYRATQAKDNIGRTVIYQYDTSGRLWKVTDPKNGVTEYTYDSAHRMLTVKDARGIVYLTNEYDANGRVSKQTLADDTPLVTTDNPTYLFAYTVDSGGRIIQTDVTDPRGNVRRVTFNTAGHPLTDTSALGTPDQQQVSLERQTGTNLITAIVDPLGRRSEYIYDSMGNLTSATSMVGTTAAATVSATYDPIFNQLTSFSDELNHPTTFEYDSKGNLTSITDALDHETKIGYDSLGQAISITDPLENTTEFTYDGGDLVQIKDPLNRIVSFFTDGAGRVLIVKDPQGFRTRFEYDALNQIKKVIEHSGATTESTYDPNGNLLTLKDARNQTTAFTYDNMDRVVTRTDALQGSTSVESYEYDVAGNAIKLTDRRGKITDVAYDPLDRPTLVGFGRTAGPAYESTVAYTYDKYDRVTEAVDSASGTITIGFDDVARTASETSPQGTVGFTFDAAGRLTGKTVTGQSSISYSYDNADRLLSISQGLASVNFSYDNANRRSTMTLPNGIVVEYGYDDASQLTSLTYKNGSTTIGDLTYQYDQSGRRTRVGGSYARTSLPPVLGSATYNAANRLTQRGSTTLTYDANGNLTNDGANTYTWNARNELVGISGSVTASFQYDAFGRRTQKTIGGVTTDYLYDGGNAAQEKVGGTVTANLLTGGVDEVFTRTESSTARSFVADGLGSTVTLLLPSGAPETDYSYEPFGNTTVSGASSTNATQYTGRENDGTGLYYYRARYYSPTLQRFISEDPIDFAGGDTNLYAYVSNSPCNFTDPSGKSALLGAAIGCVAGAAIVGAADYLSGRKLNPWRLLLGCAIGAVTGAFLGRFLGPLLRGGGRGLIPEPPIVTKAPVPPLPPPSPPLPPPSFVARMMGKAYTGLRFGQGLGEGFINGVTPAPPDLPNSYDRARTAGQGVGFLLGLAASQYFNFEEEEEQEQND